MPSEITATTAVKFFEDIDAAMERAQGGKFRAFNLAAELNLLGIDLVRCPVVQAPIVPATGLTHEDGALHAVRVATVLRDAAE